MEMSISPLCNARRAVCLLECYVARPVGVIELTWAFVLYIYAIV